MALAPRSTDMADAAAESSRFEGELIDEACAKIATGEFDDVAVESLGTSKGVRPLWTGRRGPGCRVRRLL
jgi:hypothetical protein